MSITLPKTSEILESPNDFKLKENPTIITTYYKLDDKYINRNKVFYLLPIDLTGIDFSKIEKKTGDKNEIPWPGKAGQLLSATNGKATRGLIKKVGQQSFLNSTMFLISLSNGVNRDIKIFSNTIHTCGSKKVDEGREAGKLFFDILKNSQRVYDWIAEHPDEFYDMVNVIKRETKGKEIEQVKDIVENKTEIEETREISDIKLHSIKKFEGETNEIINFCLKFVIDYETHEDYIRFISSFTKVGKLYEDFSLINCKFYTAMANYNYQLTMKIENRSKFLEKISIYPEFYSSHRDMIHIHISIILPVIFQSGDLRKIEDLTSEEKEQLDIYMRNFHINEKQRKKNKNPDDIRTLRHVFTIYRNGKITQSTPGVEHAELGYIKLRKLIQEIGEC